MKKKGRAVNLNLERISADHLSMETLLSLTSKRAGEWFKVPSISFINTHLRSFLNMIRLCSQEELRQLGGLDHLVHTMSDCLNYLTADEISIWTEPLHNKLKKVEHRTEKRKASDSLDNRCNDFQNSPCVI